MESPPQPETSYTAYLVVLMLFDFYRRIVGRRDEQWDRTDTSHIRKMYGAGTSAASTVDIYIYIYIYIIYMYVYIYIYSH
jgi:hypothetical protein